MGNLKLISGDLAGDQVKRLLANTGDSAAAVGGQLGDLQLVQGGQAVSQHRAGGIVVVGSSGAVSTNQEYGTRGVSNQNLKTTPTTNPHPTNKAVLRRKWCNILPELAAESDLKTTNTHTGLQVDLSGNGS
jgi:hypothetical protein